MAVTTEHVEVVICPGRGQISAIRCDKDRISGERQACKSCNIYARCPKCGGLVRLVDGRLNRDKAKQKGGVIWWACIGADNESCGWTSKGMTWEEGTQLARAMQLGLTTEDDMTLCRCKFCGQYIHASKLNGMCDVCEKLYNVKTGQHMNEQRYEILEIATEVRAEKSMPVKKKRMMKNSVFATIVELVDEACRNRSCNFRANRQQLKKAIKGGGQLDKIVFVVKMAK